MCPAKMQRFEKWYCVEPTVIQVCRFVGEEHTTKAGCAELIGRSIMAKRFLPEFKLKVFLKDVSLSSWVTADDALVVCSSLTSVLMSRLTHVYRLQCFEENPTHVSSKNAAF
jgi:hypothetical protein